MRPWDPEAVAEKRAARRRRNTLLAIAGALGLVVLIAVVAALVTDDDGPSVAASETTRAATPTTVAAPTTPTAGSRSTTTATTAAVGGTATTSPGRTPSSGPATTVPTGAATTVAPDAPPATTAPAPGATTTPVPAPTPAPSPEPTAAPTLTTVPPPSGAGTLDNPVPLGASAAIGDGWELRVDAYLPDATDAVMAEDEFNELPPDGFVYALATLSVTYLGSEPPGELFDVFVGALGPNDFETEMFSCDAIAPDELDPLLEVDQGATVSGNVCFALPADTATSVVMFATGGFDTDDVHFALF